MGFVTVFTNIGLRQVTVFCHMAKAPPVFTSVWVGNTTFDGEVDGLHFKFFLEKLREHNMASEFLLSGSVPDLRQ